MKTMTFSPDRVREARQVQDLSQSDLARLMDTREQNVARWESGAHIPNANAVAAIAQATGRDIEFFYVEAGGDADDEKEAALRRRARQMIRACDPELQAALMGELYAQAGA